MDPKHATVLVIDDEPDVRTLCKVNLEFSGHTVVEASGADQGVRIAQEIKPDLILLDLMMPKVDGWAVMERLKEDDGTASIPVILLTARADDESQLKGWSEGVLDYITKPFNPLSLVRLVERVLSERDPEAEKRRREEIIKQLQRMKELKTPQGTDGT